MTEISMKHLRYFEALALHGHFGRAADACAISQPALSLQVKEFEEILGAPLVERGARQIRLTTFGGAVAIRARDVLRAVEELGEMARSSRDPFVGHFRLGVIPTIAPYLLSSVVKTLAERFPRMDLRPREAVTKTLIEDLVGGRLDVAVLALPVSEPSLVEHALFDEEFVLVRPLGEAGAPAPDPDALRAMRLLLLEEGHCFRDQAIAYCRIPSARARDTMEGSSLSTLVQMVGAGLGVTLIPEMAVAIESRSAEVSIARLPSPPPMRTVGMVWRRSNPLADRLTMIADVVREVGTERRGGPPSGG
ncbi:MAG: hydrogen peroxide-inducible genes activator [Siculibacillus sp.]|nr:hydrogen peroxide-inducible genes activator [Siculibacillus sp.]